MLRLANNELETVFGLGGLLRHPKLAWLALGGNPCAAARLKAVSLAQGSLPPAASAKVSLGVFLDLGLTLTREN